MALAFSDLRIIDFTQVLAGPYASQLLAMLGADIIKIEEPGQGDPLRQMLPTEETEQYGMSPAFMTANVGKRSIALDLKHPKSREIIKRLLQDADAMMENFKAGAIERLGLGYEDVQKINPNIVYCSITGYGQQGPMRGAGAYDGAIQAASGMMTLNGHEATGPTRTGFQSVDVPTAITTAFAISSALYRKLATGEGQYVDVSMLDTAMTLMQCQYAQNLVSGHVGGLDGNNSPLELPTQNVYPTADGHIQITALTERNAEIALRVIGCQAVLDDPATADNESRRQHHDAVWRKMADALKTDSTANWCEKLNAERIPVAAIRDIPSVLADPQLEHRDIIHTVAAPGGGPGQHRLVGAAFIADQDGPTTGRPAPMLGEHNAEVLGELGYSATEIDAIRADGVFG
jgi:formyl-CoA transferase|tara:strand:- start:3966 stop:5174 length:1209 start_codon:yes stop_codon:yes gene_type:complete